MSTVQVDVDLEQVSIADLLEEILSRRRFDKRELVGLEIWALIEMLEAIGLPAALCEQLYTWDAERVVGPKDLVQWTEWVKASA